MEKHITAVAAIQIGFGVLGLIFGIFIFVLLAGIGVITHDREALYILWLVGTAIGSFFMVTSVPSIIGGIGLFKRKNWARILILILSAMDLLNIPIGTAIGIYSIWVLAQSETAELFKK